MSPEKLTEIQAIENDFDRNRALTQLVERFCKARLEDERLTYTMACVGEKVWIHLPGDDRMRHFEGTVTSIEVRGDELVAKLKDPRWPDDLIEFDPRVTMPHYYRKRKTDGPTRG